MKKIIVMSLLVILILGMGTAANAENLTLQLINQLKADLEIEDVDKETPWIEVNKEVIFDEEKINRTVTVEGKKQEDVIIIVYSGGNYGIKSFADEVIRVGYHYFPDAKNFEELVYGRIIKSYAKTYGQDYPNYEIVSINGIPWQETKYAEDIIKTVEEYKDTDASLLENNQEMMEVLKDPRFNGFGCEKFIENKSDAQILNEAEDIGNETVKNTTLEEKNEETNEKGEVENSINEVDEGAILKLGDNRATVFKKGTSNINLSMLTFPKIVEGRTMIPLIIYKNLGYKLSYDGKTKTVIIEGNDKVIELQIGSKKAVVNGKEIQMDTKAIVENGRTLIPLRFVGEQLGYKIRWIECEKKIVIGE